MRRFAPFAALAAALCACSHASVAVKRGYDFKNIHRVAVLGFSDYGREAGSGEAVASLFEKYLLKAGYDVVERRDVDKLLKEQAFEFSGAVDAQKAKELGKILGIDALVLGRLTEFAHDKSQVVQTGGLVQSYYAAYPRRHRHYYGQTTVYTTAPQTQTVQVYARVGLAARMVDAETGSVLWIGSDTEEDSTIPEAADEASGEIMDALKRIWPMSLLR